MSDSQRQSTLNPDNWRGRPGTGVVLPPLGLRTPRQEDELRQVVRKDLEAFCPAPWAVQPNQTPWRFDQTTSPLLADIIGQQTPRPHQNTMLSADGFARDVNETQSQGDPRRTAQEALNRPPNILLRQPEEPEEAEAEDDVDDPQLKFETSGDSEEGRKFTRGRHTDGTRERENRRFSTYRDTGRQFDGKYEIGTQFGSSNRRSFRSVEDDEGLGQGDLGFLNNSSSSFARAGISDDWTGGNAHLFAEGGYRRSLSLLEADGTLNRDGAAYLHGGIDVLKAEAEAKGGIRVGTYEGSPTATAHGKVGAELTVAEVRAGVGVSATPYRAWNFVVHSFNGVAEWAEWDARLEDIDKSWDWGIFLELGGRGTVGAGASAEGEIGALDDGKVGARFKGKAALGVGGGGNIGLGIQRPQR